MQEPGLDLHDWETRWAELQEEAAADPVQALPEVVRHVEQMLGERGYQLDERVTAGGDEPEAVRDFLAAREIARLVHAGTADPGDVASALANLTEIHDHLVENRAAP